MAHKGAAQRQSEGAAAFASGEPRTPPESIKSVVAKAQWCAAGMWPRLRRKRLQLDRPQLPSQQVPVEQSGAANDMGQDATLYADDGYVGATPEDVTVTEPVATPAPVGESTTNPDSARYREDLGADTPAVPAPERAPSQAMGLDPNAGCCPKRQPWRWMPAGRQPA